MAAEVEDSELIEFVILCYPFIFASSVLGLIYYRSQDDT
jgi:hypothetical protein